MATFGPTPSSLAQGLMRNPKYARGYQMVQAGSSTAPINHWAQGLARLAQSAVGTWQMDKGEKEEEGKKKERAQKLASALQKMNSGDMGGAMADFASVDEDGSTSLQLGMYGQQRNDRKADTAEARAYRDRKDAEDRAWRERQAAANRGPGPGPVPALDKQTGEVAFVDAMELRRNPGRYAPPTSGGFTIGPPGGMRPGAGGSTAGVAPQNDPSGIMNEIRGGQPGSMPAPQPGAGEGFVYEGGLPKLLPGGQGLYRNADGSMVPKPLNPNAGNPDSFKNADKLRDDFAKLSSPFITVRDSYNRIAEVAKTPPSGAGDMSLLYNYVKLLDPGSVVRESEFAMAAQSGSLGESIQAQVNKILNGQRLSDDVRRDFLARADDLYKAQKRTYDKQAEFYSGLATNEGMDPKKVLPDFSQGVDSIPQPAPPPGGMPMPAAAPPPPLPPPQAPTMETQQPAQPVAPQSRPRAVNPQTGQTIEFNGQQWVPAQ